MILRSSIFLGILIMAIACNNEKNKVDYFELLTSKEWDKPEIISNPSGLYPNSTCDESYVFTRFHLYWKRTDCPGEGLQGTWEWVGDPGIEIRVERWGDNIPAKSYILTVIELTDEVLHLIEREESEPKGTNNFWELSYRPKLN